MEKIACTLLLALVCMDSCDATEGERITSPDYHVDPDGTMHGYVIDRNGTTGEERITSTRCRISFVEPDGAEYQEFVGLDKLVDGCVLPFMYTGALKRPHRPTEGDWREMSDFGIEFEKISLNEQIKKFKSEEPSYYPGRFRLISKEHLKVEGGDVYVYRYSAIKPTKHLYDNWLSIYIAGNKSYSAIYFLNPMRGWSKRRLDKEIKIIGDLFSSFRFTSTEK